MLHRCIFAPHGYTLSRHTARKQFFFFKIKTLLFTPGSHGEQDILSREYQDLKILIPPFSTNHWHYSCRVLVILMNILLVQYFLTGSSKI
jgi:hypothetical protein